MAQQTLKNPTCPSAVSVEITPFSLSSMANSLNGVQSPVSRLMAKYRPYICPFHLLIPLIPSDATMLDIGCGNGLLLGLLAKIGKIKAGMGFDSSHKAIKAAKEMNQQLHVATPSTRLDFIQLGVDQPWPEGLFDVVSIIDVMHHVPLPAQETVIRRAASKVASGGMLLYKDMAQRPLWMATMNRLHDLVMARQWINYLPIAKVETWATSEGLKLNHSINISMFWYRHELRVFTKP